MADFQDIQGIQVTEMSAQLKPLAPWWQWIIALMLFSAGVGGFSVIPDSSWSVAYSILVLAGIAAVLAYILRKKTIPVTLALGDNCILIKDSTRPEAGKLVPSKVDRQDDRIIRVERYGTRWEIKRIELRFRSQEDTTKAIAMLARFLPNS